MIALLLAVLGGGAFAAVSLVGSDGDRMSILVGTDVSDGDFDLYAVTLGDDLERDSRVATDRSSVFQVTVTDAGLRAGGLIGDNFVISTREEGDDETELVVLDPDTGDLDQLADSRDGLRASYELSTGQLSIVEGLSSDEQTCFIADGLNEPRRLAEASSCSVDLGSGVAVTRDFRDGETEIAVYSTASGALLWSGDNVTSTAIDPDGGSLAVARQRSSGARIELIDVETNEVIAESGRADSAFVTDATSTGALGSLWDTSDNGEIVLLTATEEISLATIRRGEGQIGSSRVVGGGSLIAVTISGTDGSQTTSFFDAATGAFLSDLTGDRISLIGPDPDSDSTGLIAFVADGDETELFNVDPDTGRAERMLELDGTIDQIDFARHGRDFDLVYAVAWGFDERSDAFLPRLLAFDLITGFARVVDDDLDSYTVLRVTGSGDAIVAAADAGDTNLIIVEVANDFRAVQLDEIDDGRIGNAWLMPGGDELLYNANEDGEELVRVVELNGEADPETLYRDAQVLATSWTEPPQSTARASGL